MLSYRIGWELRGCQSTLEPDPLSANKSTNIGSGHSTSSCLEDTTVELPPIINDDRLAIPSTKTVHKEENDPAVSRMRYI